MFKTVCLKFIQFWICKNRRRVASHLFYHLFVYHFKIIVKQLEAPLSFSTSNDNLLSSKIMREYSSPSLEYYLRKYWSWSMFSEALFWRWRPSKDRAYLTEEDLEDLVRKNNAIFFQSFHNLFLSFFSST